MNVLQYIDDIRCYQKLGNLINWVYAEVFIATDVKKLIVDLETEKMKILAQSHCDIVWERDLEKEAQQYQLFE
jgi:hypothetical protein